MSGELNIAAVADLGQLGAREGPPLAYRWAFADLLPFCLPWLAILALLALKPNRGAAAWWIWAPLLAFLLLESPLDAILRNWSMEALNICANPLVFSVAGLWLLAPVITSTRRLVKWLMAFAILTAFGTVVLGIAITQNEPWADDGSLQLIVGVCLATFTLACGLAGLACRRRYSPWRFFRWLPGWFFIGWFLGVLPFFWGDLNQSYVWSFFLRAVFSGIVLTLVVTVPYFVLAFCHPLFHERLKKLWSVAEAAAPPPAPIETATAPTQGPNPSARP